jgi:hypothetical protein
MAVSFGREYERVPPISDLVTAGAVSSVRKNGDLDASGQLVCSPDLRF